MTNKLSKYLHEEEIKELQKKGSEFLDKFEQQLKGSVYRDANFYYNRVQVKQMAKAAEKYNEPLNDNSWTSGELINHAFEELVDQSHYLAALANKLQKLEKEVEDSKDQATYWRNKYLAMKRMYEVSIDPEKGKFKI